MVKLSKLLKIISEESAEKSGSKMRDYIPKDCKSYDKNKQKYTARQDSLKNRNYMTNKNANKLNK